MITREAFSFHVAPRFAIGLTAYMPTFIDDLVETRSTVSSADTVAPRLSPYGSDALPEAATTTEQRVSSLWGLPLA